MKKLPKQLKIANHNFKIIDWHVDIADAKGRFGECSYDDLEIKISTKFKESHIRETLVHELMHAIFWAYNIKAEDNEERTVTSMAVGWTQVLQDNKNLRKFLCV